MSTDRYVVMGVSGSGKSLIGRTLADALGLTFVEGDSYHPPGNVERMSRGIPLTDADRAGWLHALAARIADARARGEGLVVTCSALKRSYRDILRAGSPLRFVFLRGSRDLIAERLAARSGHFMPPSLLESQLATLEEPMPEEDAWVFDVDQTPQEIVATLVARAQA